MKKMRRMLKSVLVIALCAAMAFAALPARTALAASASISEVQYPVLQFYKYAKTFNVNKMRQYLYNKDVPEFMVSKQLKPVQNIIREENKKCFSFRIINTAIAKNNKSATMKVKVTYRSLYEAASDAGIAVLADIAFYALTHFEAPTNAQVAKYINDEMEKKVKKAPSQVVTRTVTVRVKKYGSTWKIVEAEDEMLEVCICDIREGITDSVTGILNYVPFYRF